jgi:excisionase family DNA binding protein
MMTSSPSRWMTLAQAAAYTQLSLPTLRRAIRAGRLQAAKVNGGRVYRVRLEAVEAYLRSGEATAGLEGSR